MNEMFSTSEEKFGEKYSNYIGDGNSKAFKAIQNWILMVTSWLL